jgi:hypothetical protein
VLTSNILTQKLYINITKTKKTFENIEKIKIRDGIRSPIAL